MYTRGWRPILCISVAVGIGFLAGVFATQPSKRQVIPKQVAYLSWAMLEAQATQKSDGSRRGVPFDLRTIVGQRVYMIGHPHFYLEFGAVREFHLAADPFEFSSVEAVRVLVTISTGLFEPGKTRFGPVRVVGVFSMNLGNDPGEVYSLRDAEVVPL